MKSVSSQNILPTGHPKVNKGKIGVLLMNLGTPEATSYWPMRRYLKEFLSDRRVIEVNPVLWWVILNGIILSFRPQKSGKAYHLRSAVRAGFQAGVGRRPARHAIAARQHVGCARGGRLLLRRGASAPADPGGHCDLFPENVAGRRDHSPPLQPQSRSGQRSGASRGAGRIWRAVGVAGGRGVSGLLHLVLHQRAADHPYPADRGSIEPRPRLVSDQGFQRSRQHRSPL